jgi:hypothetical protein
MNDSQFKLNPIVTMQHAYYLPPVGKSLWRKVVRDGDKPGVKAKTVYPPRPAGWPQEKDWPADIALSLVQADLLRGKSIGFLPTKIHTPKASEIEARGWPEVDTVIDEWILLEYACTFLPAQQEAIVEAVSKSEVKLPEEILKALGQDPETFKTLVTQALELAQQKPLTTHGSPPTLTRFTPLDEIEKAMLRKLNSLDVHSLADKAARDALDRLRGRV